MNQARDENQQLVQNTVQKTGGESYDCGVSGLLPWNWVNCGVRAIAWVVLSFMSLLLYIAGALLNQVVVWTVFEFSSLVGNSEGLLMAWGMLRDLANMLLLFGFIFIGIAMILDLHSYPAKKTLPRLIIFAILMNFSLFAAEAVIDVSNGLTVAFYQQASVDAECLGGDAAAEPGREAIAKCATTAGISSQIMKASGIASVYGSRGTSSSEDVSIPTTAYLGLVVLATISFIVILAAAIMLIVRAIILILLMVTAPIGFAALAIPPLENLGREWWHKLINQAFFAPVLILLILVSLRITETFANNGTRNSLAEAMSQEGVGATGILLVFAIVTGFMVASLAAAKKFGAVGATFAVNAGSTIAFGGLARGANLALGGGAYAGRRAMTRAMRRAPAGSRRRAAGRFFVNYGLKPLEGVNLDARRLPGIGAGLGALGATVGAQPDGQASFTDMQHAIHERRAAAQKNAAEFDREVAIEQLLEEARSGGGLSTDSERLLAGLSADEIASNHDLEEAVIGLTQSLSPDQFEGLMKSDKIDARVKAELADGRFKEASDAAATGDLSKKDVIRNLSNKDIEMIAKYNPGLFKDLTEISDPATGEGIFSDDQHAGLGKSNALTNSQRQLAKESSRVARIEAEVAAGRAATAGLWAAGLSSKNKAKLNVDSLKTREIIHTFSQGDLAEIQREGKLNPADIRAIMAEISGSPHAGKISTWIANSPSAGYWS